ncbi:long-chain fatty acid--CoA ligase [Epilithonimonas ginsengisoli]|uniref:Long-chain fatty acid--CoA ligase n=1 Tax=Epilithonimonas ginsengisoli TaxID=1245592 RepID=A0ABU4JD82_9FLAO|nr:MULTISPECIES: long-chain fatty acid--CoA ligase [Chryseobacterium group]MBV6878602.1 long-chain fatty acid--CoA ligase [Epilithonimonas sp. FP105]MDW8547627.1 long-chain fatty acid--CoA ligase [Epilithonimonas ginsengisoli]OAH75220.1 AMP-dependent synthetase [Chryseobacterium sp. FP211-J200]
MNITEFLTKNTKRFPQKASVGFKKDNEWKELTCLKFQQMVFKTANALVEAGVKENERVAIYADNSPEWIIMDVATLAIGAVTVPIYSTNGSDQVEYIINHAEPKIILTGDKEQYETCYQLLAKTSGVELIIAAKKNFNLNENSLFLSDFIEKTSDKFKVVERSDEDLATIIYTSGTSGIPKGVMLTHGNFQKAFDAHVDFFDFKDFEKEQSLAFLPLSHVFERCWTLFCLSRGAKVSFLENPKLIANALQEVKPTTMCSVPRFYQKIYAGINEMLVTASPTKKKIFNWAIETGTQVSERKRDQQKVPFLLNQKYKIANALVFNKIKTKLGGRLWFMPCGGASISSEVTQFFDAMGIHITVGYGMTETTATITAFPFTNYKYGTAGKLIGDSQIKIGENDEILVKGNGIMKGYYKNPEETAKILTEDGWMKTGDAGVLDNEGNLTITDRIKDLMKTSNGKYIAPQPIENMFSNNSYINQILLIADDKPFVSALIVPNFETLEEKLKSLDVDFTNWKEVVENEKVQAFYQKLIDDIQTDLSGFEKIKKFILMPADFEIQSGEITPTLKIKRNIVLEKYADKINLIYNK